MQTKFYKRVIFPYFVAAMSFLLFLYFLLSAVYMRTCIRSGFTTGISAYTGYCDKIYFENFFRPIDGWYFQMDNNQSYYVSVTNPEYMDFDIELTDTSKVMSIEYFSGWNPMYNGKIISMQNGSKELLSHAGALQYAKDQLKETAMFSCVIGMFTILNMVYAVAVSVKEIRTYRKRRIRQKASEERMEFLRANGLLHPHKKKRK